MNDVSDEDILKLHQPNRATPGGGSPAGHLENIHLISEQDVERLKAAAAAAEGVDRADEAEPEWRELLLAAKALLLKGGWVDPPVRKPPMPAKIPAEDLPEGEVVEGRALSRGATGREKAVNMPGQPREEAAEDDKGEQKAAAANDWSGDGFVFPIELIGVLHDSLKELSPDGRGPEGEDHARDALLDLIDQMEGILEGLSGSERLADLAGRKKDTDPPSEN